MTKKEFNAQKKNLKELIKYNTKTGKNKERDIKITELCNLYILNNIIPRVDFKYLPIYNSLIEESTTIIPDFDISEDVPEEDLSAKSNISKDDMKYIKRLMNNNTLKYTDKRITIKDHFEINDKILDIWFEELGISTGPTHFEKAKFNKLKASKRYLISSAQTASPVNSVFFDNMKAYAKYLGAEIGIIATRYRNPTSIWKEEGDVWDELVLPYLTAMRQDIHEDVCLVADLKIQATSPNPTGRIDSFEGHKSLIVGSPCVEMRSVPVLEKQKQKHLFSTGSITEPSFTDTVAGGKAAEHHNYGFVIVESGDDGIAHIRNVVADVDGSFNDLIFRIESGKVTKETVEYMVWGDSHFAQKEEKVINAFRGVCRDLGITNSVLHDIWDSESINVHNVKNPVVQHQLMKEGKDCLKTELRQMYSELDWFSDNMETTLVVSSNHDDMLDRAMIQSDWRDNLKNAELFISMLSLSLSGNARDGIIPYYINVKYPNIVATGNDDSYIVYGTELALHGHKGPNGSRGSLNSFAKLPTSTITGHNHSGGIKWGHYQVGISCAMKHGYNSGLSSWNYCSCILRSSGSKQLIILNKETLTYTSLY